MLPVERRAALDPGDLDPVSRSAIHAASPALARELGGSRPLPPAARAAVLRYLVRMSARPTPYGLFAGVGLARWGEETTLEIASASRPTRTRPDMGWLAGWVLSLEADEPVHVVANACAFERDGRVYLADRGTSGHRGRPDVSVRATGAVRHALAASRRPIPVTELRALLLAGIPGATPEKAGALVEELCRLDLLLSDLRPPLTGDPAGHVLGKLASRPAGADRARDLSAALTRVRAADEVRPEEGDRYAAALCAARQALRDLHRPATDGDVLQVDSSLPLDGGSVHRRVGEDAARVVDLLLGLHPAPGGPAWLAVYRGRMLHRYGPDRLVPLLELLDPRFGLGPPDRGATVPRGDQARHGRRDARLMELAAVALRQGAAEVELSDGDLEVLATGGLDTAALAPSVELSAFVVAADRAALDRGDYRLVIGPNLGGQAAGRGLARFADLLGDPAADLLRWTAEAEEAAARADATLPGAGASPVIVELVYLPARHRTANVTVRPAVRGYEIPVGVSAGVDAGHVIAPDRLAVVVRDGRLRLWWPDADREVLVASGHMLNPAAAPAMCRFLSEVGQDGITALTGFDWGPASALPFLPRVRAGRVVLRPAQWRGRRDRWREVLSAADPGAFPRGLDRWRRQWAVPREVYLAVGDNRLLLDLDDPDQAGLLRADLCRPGHGDVVLHEGLPASDQAWLPGPGGHYVSELVIPLVRRAPAPGPAAGRSSPQPAAGRASPRPAASEADRLRPPGSDWLYATLAGQGRGEDALLAGPVRSLATGLLGGGDADAWFVVRYAAPERHLRLRLHGDPERLVERTLPLVARWAARLVAAGERSRFGIEAYEREVERYGGPAAMTLAEAVFCADSAAACELLALIGGHEDRRLELAVLGIDALLRGLEPVIPQRRSWLGLAAPPPLESGTAWRERKGRLRTLLADRAGDGDWAREADPVLGRLAEQVRPAAERIAALDADGALHAPAADVVASLIHMHANRIGLDRAGERLALGLLHRALASLDAAPLSAR
jgi:lantibiotic biosynthesis protein